MDLSNTGKTASPFKVWLIIALASCAAIVAFIGLLASRYGEPIAQDSAKPIIFMDSLDAAFSRARDENRRVLIYFTGDSCSWCRVLEKEVHSKPEMIALASEFVCVKVNTTDRPDLAEQFGAHSLPRTLILNAKEQPISLRIGYSPLEEHLAWLKNTRDERPTTMVALLTRADSTENQEELSAPPAIGATLEGADVVFWFVASDAERFSDSKWNLHSELLHLTKEGGVRSRIEHVYRWEFANRWESAKRLGKLPDFVISNWSGGLCRELMSDGTFRDIISSRLKTPDATSPCTDFGGWGRIWQVLPASKSELAEKAVSMILSRRKGTTLGPLAELSAPERKQAMDRAMAAASAWINFDFKELENHWHPNSPQRFTADTIDPEWVKHERGMNDTIQFSDVLLYGTSELVVAMIETTRTAAMEKQLYPFVSRSQVIGSPTIVIMKRGEFNYSVLTVGTWRWDVGPSKPTDPSIFALSSATKSSPAGSPSKATILEPHDNSICGNEPVKIRWRSDKREGVELSHFAIKCDDFGTVTIDTLTPDDDFEIEIRSDTLLEIWTVGSDGEIAISDPVNYCYATGLKE